MKKLTLVQKRRLLAVARALRESPNPKGFRMSCYVNGDGTDEEPQDMVFYTDKDGNFDPKKKEDFCGTPACALGHFGARSDLQKFLTLGIDSQKKPTLRYVDSGSSNVNYYSKKIEKYFGITHKEATELFGYDGCGDAKTPNQAAKFIETFVLKHA